MGPEKKGEQNYGFKELRAGPVITGRVHTAVGSLRCMECPWNRRGANKLVVKTQKREME